MLEINQKRTNNINIIGFLSAILGTIIFIILISIAHIYAHAAGYIIKELELSELVLDSNIAKILFNTGVIFYGICLLIALMTAIPYFKEKKKHKIFIPLAIITCISLIGVGVFSEDQFLNFHLVVAFIFYLCGGTLAIYSSIIFVKYDKTIPLFYSIIGFSAVFMLIFNIVTRWFFGQAYTQRIAICLFILYFLLISGKILLNNLIVMNKEN